jgi:hypothetical protein
MAGPIRQHGIKAKAAMKPFTWTIAVFLTSALLGQAVERLVQGGDTPAAVNAEAILGGRHPGKRGRIEVANGGPFAGLENGNFVR